jgi:Mg2+-importing ATPase
MAELPDASWWTKDSRDVLASLSVKAYGLTQEAAEKRLIQYGRNVFVERKKDTVLTRIISKLSNPLLLLLLAAAFISAGLGQVIDFVIIVAILSISISLDVYQEHQAVEGAEKLRARVTLTASVLRDGVVREIPISHVVPGDIVHLSVGDIVPADCRILSETDLLVDQSTLTGESFPQEKDASAVVTQSAPVSERTNCVFMGTHVISGVATVVVVKTGNHTELGSVAKSLVVPRPKTEFEKGIHQFGVLLARTALIVSGIVLLSHIALGHDLLSSLLFVLALAIGFAPELLPVILTINLSKGALRMAKKGVIVKSLPAIENFGSIDILATDKTGTLTENVISLTDYINIQGIRDERIHLFGYLNSKHQTGYKGPMEEALVAHKTVDTDGYVYESTLPFDFFRKRVSVVFHKDKKHILIVKGAPEELLSLSTQYADGGKTVTFTPPLMKKAKSTFEKLSTQGLRMLAVAAKTMPESDKKLSVHDEKDLIFMGFLTFQDPPKASVAEALGLLRDAGVETKILTGDNELVTQKICADLKLPVKGILKGAEIAGLTQGELGKRALDTTIFARLNPAEKERVLTALRAMGKVVGYLGDGINDAPSLRASDIGISVNNAADVAKESADIILLHKSLHVVYEGVIEGRKTFGNVMKYLNMGMSSNFGNMLSVAVSSVFLPFLPLLPIQVLLNDMFYDASQLLLANDTVDQSYLMRPRKWSISSIRRFMFVFGPVSSLFDFVTFGLLLWYFKANAQLFQTGWFLESIVTQTLIVMSIRTQLVPFTRSKINTVFASGLIGIVAISLILPFTPVGKLFSFVVLPTIFYVWLVAIVVTYVLLVELLKLWFYKGEDLSK